MSRSPTPKRSVMAIMVKTPGFSPVKSRLAKTLGREAAEKIYVQCCAAVEALCANFNMISGCEVAWAVAEKDAVNHAMWKRFPKIVQKDGDLGTRLHGVFEDLTAQYQNIILLGADCPHISNLSLITCLNLLSNAEPTAVIGPATDGGFYLLGLNFQVPSFVWTHNIRYSTPQAMEDLEGTIFPLARIVHLPALSDIDEEADLPIVIREMAQVATPNHALIQLKEMLEVGLELTSCAGQTEVIP